MPRHGESVISGYKTAKTQGCDSLAGPGSALPTSRSQAGVAQAPANTAWISRVGLGCHASLGRAASRSDSWGMAGTIDLRKDWHVSDYRCRSKSKISWVAPGICLRSGEQVYAVMRPWSIGGIPGEPNALGQLVASETSPRISEVNLSDYWIFGLFTPRYYKTNVSNCIRITVMAPGEKQEHSGGGKETM